MQAVVLVGGLGTRLRPLTASIPKQLLPVGGVPIIERVLARLAAHGVEHAVLSMGYLPDPFLSAYPSRRIDGVEVEFAIEDEPLGTAGALRFAAEVAGIDETFLAVNGDVLTDQDVGALVALHRARGAEGTILLTPVEDPSRYGVVVTDETSRVLQFVEKPPRDEAPSTHINAGTYVLEPSVLSRVPAGTTVSIEREVFPVMVTEGRLFARLDPAYWLDAGTPQAYLQANTDLLDGVWRAGVRGSRVGSTLRMDGATVAASATVERSVLSADAVVGDRAVVRGAVLLAGAQVGAHATVVDSVIGPHAVVGAGSTVAAHSVLASGARVACGVTLEGAGVAE